MIAKKELEVEKLAVDIKSKKEDIKAKKMSYALSAKKLIEFETAQWLFFSFIEKIARDMLTLPGKNAVKISNLVDNKDSEEIIRLFENELGVVLREVKDAQKKEYEEWSKGK